MVFDTMLVCHFIGPNHAVVIDNFGSRGATKYGGLILEQRGRGSETHRTLLGVKNLQSPPTFFVDRKQKTFGKNFLDLRFHVWIVRVFLFA